MVQQAVLWSRVHSEPELQFPIKNYLEIFFDSFLALWFEALLKMFCRGVFESIEVKYSWVPNERLDLIM